VVGDVPATALTVNEFAEAISIRLQDKVGLALRPETSVEVIQCRPFYVLGQVEQPGEFPYRPGLTVIQAVGIAGGFARLTEASLMRFEREAITARGEARVLQVERAGLLARRARLAAEVDEKNSIAFPAELQTSAANDQIKSEEEALFQSRRQALRSQVDALSQVKGLIGSEIEALRAKSQSQTHQIGLVRKELDSVNALVSKGLTVTSRQLSLEQSVAQFETTLLDINLSVLRAQQDLNKAERNTVDLKVQRRNDVLVEMRQTQAKILENEEKAQTVQDLIYDSEVRAPQEALSRSMEEMRTTFTVMRGSGDALTQVVMQETDLVQPGDTIKVDRRLPSTSRRYIGLAPRNELKGGTSVVVQDGASVQDK
jgi:hypothetical protein